MQPQCQEAEALLGLTQAALFSNPAIVSRIKDRYEAFKRVVDSEEDHE